MISCKSISSSSSAAAYHLEKNGQQKAGDGQAEYYQKDEVRSAWAGAGADLYKGADCNPLGQGSPVEKADFIHALGGRVVDANGAERQLGKWDRNEAGEKVWEHRAGLDFTFSAPKSVSIGAEVFGQAEVRQAHEAAVGAALRFLEGHAAQARINGETVATGNLLVARFEHSISRELDPQTHTHCIIANATYHSESGKWYSLSNEKLLEWRATADQIYKNEMAAQLQAAGYKLHFDGKGGFEIAGFTKEQLAEFSTRSQQIDGALRARGIDPATASHEARQAACLDTRAGKDAPDNPEGQRAQWQERAQAVGIAAPAADQAHAHAATARNADQALAKALNHITEREAAFSEREIYKQTAVFSHGSANLQQIDRAIEKATERGELIRREDGKLTTQEMVGAEKWAAAQLEAGRGAHRAVMTEKEFRAALAGFEDRKGLELTAEQREASRMILTGDDRFQGVQGLAGTGKTTMLEFVREAAESKGWRVEGFSNGAEQAAKLQQESGIQATTTARHLIDQDRAGRDADLAAAAIKSWQEGKVPGGGAERANPEFDSAGRAYFTDKLGNTWTPGLHTGHRGPSDEFKAELAALARQAGPANDGKTLRVMDEASMSGQREFNRVIQTTEAAGARTVFLGDKLQHQGVEAGRAFEKAQAHMPTARLGQESIRRQTTEAAKETVARILGGKHGEAVKGLPTVEARAAQEKAIAAGGDKAEIRAAARIDNQAVIGRLAADYARLAPEARQGTLVLTSTNADRQALNQAIREELKARGELGEGRRVAMLERADRTAAQLREAVSFQKGDAVQFQRDYRSLGVEKGQTGEVLRADARLNTVTVKLDSGREITVLADRQRMQTYERVEKEFTAGDRVRFTQNDHAAGMRNGQQGTVEKFDGKTMTVKLDSGQTKAIDLDQHKHVDHAYVSTSHGAQGQTADRVMIHHNTEAGRHGDRETYVNATRAREDVTVYTQDVDRAATQAGIELNKEVAIEPARGADQAAGVDPEKEASAGSANESGSTEKVSESETGRAGPAEAAGTEARSTGPDKSDSGASVTGSKSAEASSSQSDSARSSASQPAGR